VSDGINKIQVVHWSSKHCLCASPCQYCLCAGQQHGWCNK